MNTSRTRERARTRRPRAEPFSPRAVADLQGWWEAAHLTELAPGDSVARWDDRSGLGHDATQPLALKRPHLAGDSVAGLPSVVFDGADDALVGVTDLAAGSAWTMFVVANTDAPSPDGRVFTLGVAAPDQELGLGADPTGSRLALSVSLRAGDRTGALATSASNAGWHVASLVYTPGGAVELRRNGGAPLAFADASAASRVRLANGARAPPFAFGAAPEGGGHFQRVSLAAALLYGRALTAAERAQVERRLGARYGITTD
jgi:hypothetical protein